MFVYRYIAGIGVWAGYYVSVALYIYVHKHTHAHTRSLSSYVFNSPLPHKQHCPPPRLSLSPSITHTLSLTHTREPKTPC